MGATFQNIPMSAWATSPALQRGTLRLTTGLAELISSLGMAHWAQHLSTTQGPVSHLTSDHLWAESSCRVPRVQTPGPWAPCPG